MKDKKTGQFDPDELSEGEKAAAFLRAPELIGAVLERLKREEQEQQPTMRLDLGNGQAIYPKKGVDLKALGINDASPAVRKTKGREAMASKIDDGLLSTSKLAKQLGVATRDVFAKFEELGWVVREGDASELGVDGSED